MEAISAAETKWERLYEKVGETMTKLDDLRMREGEMHDNAPENYQPGDEEFVGYEEELNELTR